MLSPSSRRSGPLSTWPKTADIQPDMVPLWCRAALAGLSILVLGQWLGIYLARVRSKKRDELFRIVTENAADMIALVDVKGRRLYNSPSYKRILGYSAAELGETSAFEQIHPDDRFKVLDAAREARSTGIGRRLEYRVRHKNGSWKVLESIARAIRNEKGEVSKLVIVNRDITERKHAQEQLEHNSFHDILTGLPNRRLFLDRLQHLFERERRGPERQYAVLIADLDDFKRLNDELGSALCDQVLVEIGGRLDSCLRDEDMISRPHDDSPFKNAVLSRLGGDEFTILLEGIADPSDAMRAGSRVLSAIAEPISVQDHAVRCSASVGIGLSTTAHEHAEDVLQEADTAMRRAKALGGGRCEVFNDMMHSRAVNQLRLEAELQHALANRQFRVHYQPIVHMKTGQIMGFEALLRWQHPQHGLISAHKFLATAEHTGLLASVGQWLILESCRQLHSWIIETPAASCIGISANISAKQLADASFVAGLQSALRETGIAPSQLQLELTEPVAAADPKITETILSNLKQLSVGVILDDFGTGNSSLLALRQLPVQAVKIDRSLITAMLLDRGALEVVELIILLAQKLKLKVIAEGIESAKQLDHLQALGCELGQGYFFSPPVEAKQAQQLLIRGNPALHASTARSAH
jgi:diguanylate cyclase (GGDEF)-like protein/PAS domain S-box-containing protein